MVRERFVDLGQLLPFQGTAGAFGGSVVLSELQAPCHAAEASH